MHILRTERLHDGFCQLEAVYTDQSDAPFEVLRTTDSVSVLLYDRLNDRVLLAKQSRVAMVRDDNPDGLIEEVVAGRFDLAIGARGLVVKEALEEVGVTLTEDEVFLLNDGLPMALSAGVLTERGYLAYAEIRPEQIETEERVFGVDEHENITRVWVPVSELATRQYEDVRVFALVQWFLRKLEQERR